MIRLSGLVSWTSKFLGILFLYSNLGCTSESIPCSLIRMDVVGSSFNSQTTYTYSSGRVMTAQTTATFYPTGPFIRTLVYGSHGMVDTVYSTTQPPSFEVRLYDALGRLEEIRSSLGGDTTRYEYNSHGQLVKEIQVHSTIIFSYTYAYPNTSTTNYSVMSFRDVTGWYEYTRYYIYDSHPNPFYGFPLSDIGSHFMGTENNIVAYEHHTPGLDPKAHQVLFEYDDAGYPIKRTQVTIGQVNTFTRSCH